MLDFLFGFPELRPEEELAKIVAAMCDGNRKINERGRP